MEEKEEESGAAKHYTSNFTDSIKQHSQSQILKERENSPGLSVLGYKH